LTIVYFGTAPLNVSSATISGSEFTFTPSFPLPVVDITQHGPTLPMRQIRTLI
jgi:hypothetical protein